jgi:hypothetical protein
LFAIPGLYILSRFSLFLSEKEEKKEKKIEQTGGRRRKMEQRVNEEKI